MTFWTQAVAQDASTNEEAPARDDITSTDFQIDVGLFAPGGTINTVIPTKSEDTATNINTILSRIITILMSLFGVIAVFIMSIGAGFMIFSHGQDELLSRGKSIFFSGLIALAVALCAGIIINLVAAIIYNAS